jgi:hypothetical protein
MEATLTENVGQTYENCEHCHSPVERTQRYCVVCGSRRKHVPDPAVRFLGGAASRSRTAAAAGAPAGRPGRGRRSAGLGTAIVIAIIPLAVAVGLLVGRAGNGTDSKLLSALHAAKAEVVNIQSGAGATTSADVSSSSTTKHSKGKHSSSTKGGSGKVLSTTKYGSFHSVASNTPPSQAQLNQGAQVVKHDQSQTGGSYINSQKNLPNSIAVP